MKQGTGNKSSAPKSGNRHNVVSLDALSRIGVHTAHTKGLAPLIKKSHVEAPVSTRTQHSTGSQGKHK